MNGEIAWLEPKKDPISGSYLVFSAKDSDMERWTGLEPVTFSLARRRSTTELSPLVMERNPRFLSKYLPSWLLVGSSANLTDKLTIIFFHCRTFLAAPYSLILNTYFLILERVPSHRIELWSEVFQTPAVTTLANSACINALFRTDLFKEQIYLFSWYCLRDTIYTCRGGMNGVPSGILLFYRKLLWDSIFIPEQHLYVPRHVS